MFDKISNKIFFHILNKQEIHADSLNKYVWSVGRIILNSITDNSNKKKTKLRDKLHFIDFTAAVKWGLFRRNWQTELNVDGGLNIGSMYTIRRGWFLKHTLITTLAELGWYHRQLFVDGSESSQCVPFSEKCS